MKRGLWILLGGCLLASGHAWAGSQEESWTTLERVRQDRLQVQRDFVELDRTRRSPGHTAIDGPNGLAGWDGRFVRDQAWLVHEEQAAALGHGTEPLRR